MRLVIQCLYTLATHLEIKAVRKVDIVGSIDPPIDFRIESSRDGQVAKLIESAKLNLRQRLSTYTFREGF